MFTRKILGALLQASLLGLTLAQDTKKKGEINRDNGPVAYQPSIAGNVIFGILYVVLGIAFSYYIHVHRSRWAICLPAGAIASAVGFFLRCAFDADDLQLSLFIASTICVVASPSAFLAFNYMLYGRFITAIDPKFGNTTANASTITLAEDGTKQPKGSLREPSKFSFIPPLIVGRIFIISDILTFIVQVTAGGMQSQAGDDNLELTNIADKLFLAAVCAQGISYCLFTLLLTVALIRLVADRTSNKSRALESGIFGLGKQTTLLACGFYISSLFIILRSVYRILEYTQGHQGFLMSHEVYLFVLDAAPLILAIGIWAFIWPTILLDRIANETRALQSNQPNTSSVHHNNNSRSDWVPLV
ncbi:hypothetical protein BGZ52_002702 [Haplosporangium bisporale]|nr:hypothetical protein BGZ52_002702 [Haplosporangium bisporale]KAF9209133.1 hypothetical protein BGZ59_010251 [Podila verticillata]KFH64050.1 hypothetical protein MVEG_09875 [Podila verticillata NRRL 6337]